MSLTYNVFIDVKLTEFTKKGNIKQYKKWLPTVGLQKEKKVNKSTKMCE